MLGIVGAITVGMLSLASIILTLTIAANILCGILGAVRFRRALNASSASPAAWRWIAREGIRSWYGRRYNGDVGEYWVVGGLKVPHDIRDPIGRSDFYGA